MLPPSPPVLTEDWARRALSKAVNRVIDAQSGERNTMLNRQAFMMGRFVSANVIDEALVMTALYRAGRHAGLDDAESRATLRSGFEAGLRHPLNDRSRG